MRLLFAIADMDCRGGAHVATLAMVDALRHRGHVVDIFSSEGAASHSFVRRGLFDVLSDRRCSFREKAERIGVAFCKIFGVRYREISRGEECRLAEQAERYDRLVVMGENSPYRYVAARLRTVRTVLLVHTDLSGRRRFLGGWRMREKDYDSVYAKIGVIGVVGRINAEGFQRQHSDLKVLAFHNLIVPPKVRRGDRPLDGTRLISVVSLVRFDRNKDVARMVRVAAALKSRFGGCFRWTVWGDGELFGRTAALVRKLGVDDVIVLPGYDPRAASRLGEYDLMVLASHYEGLPNVIYESMSAGVPVLTTAVGGVSEQVTDGVNGWLAADDEVALTDKLGEIVAEPAMLWRATDNLRDYHYDNRGVVDEMEELLNAD